MSDSSRYDESTREQLLDRIKELETQLENINNKTISSSSGQELSHSKSTNDKKKHRKEYKSRPFDMSKYTLRKVAFRVAYIGWDYMGFASQGEPDRLPTIEDQLFKALKGSRLINDINDVDYSRCGRTDKGVSGLGQVISLFVRSKQLVSSAATTPLPVDQELDYIDNLNRILPPHIRILAWSPVPDDFNARFHCIGRTYKYFFSRQKMNIAKIKQACAYFEGTHDFRNFCKLDPSKNITSYERIIMSMTVKPVPHTLTADIGDGTDFYEIELKGTAFLWHQVRFMMSVLFLIGQGLEPPETVCDLLDVEKCPSKPDFPMASDLPLVLYDCHFKDLAWHYNVKEKEYESLPCSYKTYLHYSKAWQEEMIRSLTCQSYLEKVGEFPVVKRDGCVGSMLDFVTECPVLTESGQATLVLGGGKEGKAWRYKPVLERPKCDTDDLKKEKYEGRKKRKIEREEAAAATGNDDNMATDQ